MTEPKKTLDLTRIALEFFGFGAVSTILRCWAQPAHFERKMSICESWVHWFFQVTPLASLIMTAPPVNTCTESFCYSHGGCTACTSLPCSSAAHQAEILSAMLRMHATGDF